MADDLGLGEALVYETPPLRLPLSPHPQAYARAGALYLDGDDVATRTSRASQALADAGGEMCDAYMYQSDWAKLGSRAQS